MLPSHPLPSLFYITSSTSGAQAILWTVNFMTVWGIDCRDRYTRSADLTSREDYRIFTGKNIRYLPINTRPIDVRDAIFRNAPVGNDFAKTWRFSRGNFKRSALPRAGIACVFQNVRLSTRRGVWRSNFTRNLRWLNFSRDALESE